MNYNYSQPQYQIPSTVGYSGYKPAPQYPQWSQPVSATTQVRPVSSIEEVKACPIDFDGSVFYFTDIANKRIYTKQINLDGTASINLYELKEFPQVTNTDQSTTPYVTKQEFEETINQLKEMYNKISTSVSSTPVVPVMEQLKKVEQEV